MKLFCLGLNHRSAPVEVRERVAFAEEQVTDALHALIAERSFSETVILSTCNRVEIYGVADDLHEGLERALRFVARYHDFDLDKYRDHFYSHVGLDAARHLLRVCASLDSLVVGEPQILGQVKDAYRLSAEAGATGLTLNRVFHKAFQTAKRVRTETQVGTRAVGVSYAAVELAQKIFGTLTDHRVLLVGAGEMSRTAAQHLKNQGAVEILVSNRTRARSEELALEFGGKVVPFEDLTDVLPAVDIVICSAAAPHYVIRPEHVGPAVERRRSRPMFFIDISVPRNIDPEINEFANVYYYDIDDLETVVQANRREREREAARAEEIVGREVESIRDWVRSLEWVPTVAAVRQKADRIAQEELERTLKGLKSVADEDRARLEKMVQAIVAKILHEPIQQVKEAARLVAEETQVEDAEPPVEPRKEQGLASAFRKLFGLDGDDGA